MASYCGKETYQFGDLSKEVDRRIKVQVSAFTGKEYELGDISKELERRRQEWVKGYLGTDEYQFGDVTKKAVSDFTGKDEYEFGDISKKIFGEVSEGVNRLFGPRKGSKS